MLDRIGKKKEIFWLVGAMALLFIVVIWHIEDNNGIKLYADEMGYWRNAALLTGRDWSGEASSSSYYGFGYGFLLAPIVFMWNHDPALMMHAATILNALMLVSCILASWLIIGRLHIELDYRLRVICSLVPALYSSYVFYVNLSISEVLLATCFWWMSYLLLGYLQDKKNIQMVGIICLSIYMLCSHPRAIIVVAISAFILVLSNAMYNFKNKKIFFQKIALILVTLALGYLAYKLYDTYYTKSLYSMAVDGGETNNRIGPAVSTAISSFLTFEGLKMLAISMCGKLFSSLTGSLGMNLWGMVAVVLMIQKAVNSRQIAAETLWYFFVGLSYLAAILATAVVGRSGYETRNDILVYGRYPEFVYGPILLIGVIYLFQCSKIETKKILMISCMTMILAIICYYNTYATAQYGNFWCHCVALADLATKAANTRNSFTYVIFMSALRSTLIITFMSWAVNFKGEKTRRIGICLMLMVVSCVWVNVSNENWKGVMKWYSDRNNTMTDIVQGMSQEKEFVVMNAYMGGCFQYMLPNTVVTLCADIDELTGHEGVYVITDRNYENVEYIYEKYDVEKENGNYIRWIYSEPD